MSKADVIRDWLAITGRHPVLEQEEVNRLTKLVQNPQTPANKKAWATHKLVKHNAKFVVDMTLKFLRKRTNYQLTDDRIADYLQQGTLGLLKAIEKFDPSKGHKFSTYAYTWVRGYLGRHHYNNFSLVHVPEQVVCAVLHKNKPELAEFTTAARQFQGMDSLDRPVNQDGNEIVYLKDIVSETLYATPELV